MSDMDMKSALETIRATNGEDTSHLATLQAHMGWCNENARKQHERVTALVDALTAILLADNSTNGRCRELAMLALLADRDYE